MSELIVVNGPLGLYYYYMISSDTKTHDILLSLSLPSPDIFLSFDTKITPIAAYKDIGVNSQILTIKTLEHFSFENYTGKKNIFSMSCFRSYC